MKLKKTYGVVVLTLLLFTSRVPAQQADEILEQEQAAAAMPVIPQHLSHATDFVKLLQEMGVVVQEVGICHCNGTFQGDIKTAFIRTNKGIAEINIFPGEKDAKVITFTESRGEGRTYKYSFYGQPTLGYNEMSSCCPFYFTMYRNWFIRTRDVELDALLKARVRQKEKERAR